MADARFGGEPTEVPVAVNYCRSQGALRRIDDLLRRPEWKPARLVDVTGRARSSAWVAGSRRAGVPVG